MIEREGVEEIRRNLEYKKSKYIGNKHKNKTNRPPRSLNHAVLIIIPSNFKQ